MYTINLKYTMVTKPYYSLFIYRPTYETDLFFAMRGAGAGFGIVTGNHHR